METTIMENQMEKNMENEMEYVGVIYYSSFHLLRRSRHFSFLAASISFPSSLHNPNITPIKPYNI